MDMVSYLFEPVVLFGMLAVLFVFSMVVIFSVWRREEGFKKLQGQVQGLQEEAKKLREELAVKSKMHDGLKGQYDELEKDYEKLRQEPENLKQPRNAEQEKTEIPAKKDSSGQSIVDLLKDLQALQKPPSK